LRNLADARLFLRRGTASVGWLGEDVFATTLAARAEIPVTATAGRYFIVSGGVVFAKRALTRLPIALADLAEADFHE
jgi:hypothetical protein